MVLPPQNSDDLADYMVRTNQAIRTMLTAVASCTVGLGLTGGWCLLSGQLQTGRLLWLGSLSGRRTLGCAAHHCQESPLKRQIRFSSALAGMGPKAAPARRGPGWRNFRPGSEWRSG